MDYQVIIFKFYGYFFKLSTRNFDGVSRQCEPEINDLILKHSASSGSIVVRVDETTFETDDNYEALRCTA